MTALDQENRVRALLRSLGRRDPFWGAQVVVACTIALDVALSNRLTLGPRWLVPALEGLLLVVLVIASPHPRLRHSQLRRRMSLGLIGLVSAFNLFSLVQLCDFLIRGGQEAGRSLIGSGMLLWVNNVLLFGLWFWQLDRGGPVARLRDPEATPDFLFVQMTDAKRFARPDWQPSLSDYLYTSFTNATAFSPTDTMPLTVTAKALMAIQATAALVTVGLVVARAVNILS